MGFGWGGAAATAAATPVFVEGVILLRAVEVQGLHPSKLMRGGA
jgi:hypothetical protein